MFWKELGLMIAKAIVGEALAGKLGGRKAKKIAMHSVELYQKVRDGDALYDAVHDALEGGQTTFSLSLEQMKLVDAVGAAGESIAARVGDAIGKVAPKAA